MNIVRDKNEAQALLQLLDIAVRARGLDVAPAALMFVERIKDALVEVPPAKLAAVEAAE